MSQHIPPASDIVNCSGGGNDYQLFPSQNYHQTFPTPPSSLPRLSLNCNFNWLNPDLETLSLLSPLINILKK